MRDYRGEIYKTAREQAGLTQEQAAYLLRIGTRTLGGYETGENKTPDDIVCSMVDVYGVKWLWYMHLKINTSIGTRFLPEVDLDALPATVLKLQKELSDVHKINDQIVEVACDGKIELHEEEIWSSSIKEIRELAGACLSFTLV